METPITWQRLYWDTTMRHPWTFGIWATSLLCAIACTYAPLIAVKAFFDAMHQNRAEHAFRALAVVLGLRALQRLAEEGTKYADRFLIPDGVLYLNDVAMKRGLEKSYAYYTDTPSGLILSKLLKLGGSYEPLFEQVYELMHLATALLVTLIALSFQNVWLFGAVAGYVAITLWFVRRANKELRPLDEQKRETRTRQSATMADIIGHATTILFHATQTKERKRFYRDAVAFRDAWQTRAWANRRHWLTVALLAFAFEVVVLLLLFRAWSHGQMSVGTVVALQGLVTMTAGRMQMVYLLTRQWQDVTMDAEDAMNILNAPSHVTDKPRARMLDVREGTIAFSNVTFGYEGKEQVLTNLSFVIKPRERVALVGRSGAGKSTITKLLLRCEDPTGGCIRIDGEDLRNVTQQSLRWAIAYVPQDPALFHRTIRENIAYGRQDATHEDIVEAAKRAQCHDFISALPNGYDTLVGERGVKLSGGERQRVAIARAILKDAPILVLDEATSSLDPEHEHEVQAAMEEVMRDKTVVVIAHRLSTVRKMDRAIVIDKGRIVDEGTHEDLIQRDTLYRDFWERQTGDDRSTPVPPRTHSCAND